MWTVKKGPETFKKKFHRAVTRHKSRNSLRFINGPNNFLGENDKGDLSIGTVSGSFKLAKMNVDIIPKTKAKPKAT